jgi:mono/diheme cytochrome c family protein
MRFGILVVTAAVVGMGAAGAAFADGAAVYKANCAKCHGDSGAADSAAAKAMKVPALAGDAKIAAMADADLAKSIAENKKHAGLKAVSAEDIAAAAKYVKGLAGGK